MKFFITGITGFVGSHLADYLLTMSDVDVYGLKRWRSPLDNIKHALNELHLLDGDLRDGGSISRIIDEVKPDRIFHLAAQSYVPSSFTAPADTMDTNIDGTLNLLEAVKQSGIDSRIHICSSSEVYGQVTKEELPIREDNPLRPQSPYAVSKVGEDILSYQYFRSYGLKTIRTRAFTHTGPRRGSVFVESAFAKQIAEIEKGKKSIIHVGNLDSVRTFMDVRDTVRAYWLVTEKGEPGEVYVVGGNTTMTIGEMLNKLLAMTSIKGIDVKVDQELLRPSDVTLQIPDSSKLRKATGWEPVIPFEKTLEDLLNYWRDNV